MRTLVLVSVALLVAACQGGGPVVVDGGRDLGPMDLGARDAGDPCSRSEDCEDGVACTRDVCDGRGVCVHTPDPLSCDDGVFCNGAEVCDPNAGCVAGALRDCNDRNVCTLDRCDEGRGMCLHLPRDFDNDGEADARCAGGTDCDDADPLRGTLQAELCSDGLDNDCDLSIDEAVCGRPPHDQCEDALDVSAGGLFDLSTAGARDDYGALCSGPAREVVARFVLDDARDVTLRADAAGSTQVELRSGCGGATVLRCDTGSPGEVRRRALPAGTYYAFVASSAGSVQLSVAFDPPTTQPSNEDCGSARTVIPPFAESGSFVGTVDDLTLSCGQPLAGDLVYAFEVPAGPPQDVVVAFAATSTTDAVRFSLRSTCSDASSELGCVRGSPAGGRFRSLAPGPYVLAVEGPAEREVDFAIDVRLEPGTTAPPGDSCAAPIDTPLEQIVHGTLADKRDAIQTPCGFFYRDAVHRFVLSEPRDVSIDLLAGTNGGAFVFGALGDTCEAMLPTTDYCVGGAPALLQRLALPAGEHFVVVEAPGTPTYQLEIHTAAPTSVVDAAGNDTCADAIVIPSQSSVVYRGDTSTLANDVTSIYCGSGARSPDATFLLELTEATVVRLSTAGSSFDTTLLVFLEGAACSNFPYACDDDSGPGGTSSIERELPAGRYHVVVDGFGGHSAGPYVLRVDRGPFPP